MTKFSGHNLIEQPEKAEQHSVRGLKGKRFDGTIVLRGVRFHMQGTVIKNFVKRGTCLIKTKVNPRTFIKTDVVKALISSGEYVESLS